MRRALAGILGVGTLLLAAGLFVAPRVQASAYGESHYGVCKFERRCPPKHTVVETKSGLEVAINLTDGQQIPKGEYEVKVTPLNGEGRSFERVEFYLDGALLSTFYPDSTGTATWLWDTNRHHGAKVKVIVYDTDGTTVTREFTVRITDQPAGSEGLAPVGGAGTGARGQAEEGFIGQVLAFLEATIRAIPTPVAISLPYLLLVVLLLIILLLYAQSRREAAELERRMAALKRARQLAEEKDGFVQLASHYLRTPLTLIRGGVDLLGESQVPADSALLGSLGAAVGSFGAATERILGGMASDPRLKDIPAAAQTGASLRVWAAPQFWAPVLGIGLVLAFLDYLLMRAGKLDGSFIFVATHIGLYLALVIALYNVVRWRHLRAQDRRRTELQESQQAAIDEARNNLIREASATLAQNLEAMQLLVVKAPDGQGKKFMQEGCTRIAEVLKRFRATATVIPPVTAMPLVRFTLGTLLAQAERQVTEAAATKQVAITAITPDIALASPQPSWLVQILASVLDNAIAYSPAGSPVEVGGTVKDGIAMLYVRDHGQGIPAQKLAELFQPFSRAEGAMAFDHPGIGLSLYLDRLLITNLGGHMQIDSAPGSGTTVHVVFPVR